MTIAAGGALRDNLESRLMNDASNVAGRCLFDRRHQRKVEKSDKCGAYVELRNISVSLKNLARCFE
jgi:hypothetical protein